MLTLESTIDALLERTCCFTPHQEAGLRQYLEDATVATLLQYQTPQELANDIEKEARAQYEAQLAEQGKSKKARPTIEFLAFDCSIRLSDMGDVAFRLLQYVHQMFDSIPHATPGVGWA